ncbi:hypothetical protein ACETU7_06495 [Rhodococcus sp. 3Y1]
MGPALRALGELLIDEVIAGVEECLQLGLSEAAPVRWDGVIGLVARRVPLEHDLGGNVVKYFAAERSPPIPFVSDVIAEGPDRASVRAQRRHRDGFRPGSSISQELIDMDRLPAPRILVGVLLEPRDQAARGPNERHTEPTGQHLRSPAIEHRLKDSVLGSQQPDDAVRQGTLAADLEHSA